MKKVISSSPSQNSAVQVSPCSSAMRASPRRTLENARLSYTKSVQNSRVGWSQFPLDPRVSWHEPRSPLKTKGFAISIKAGSRNNSYQRTLIDDVHDADTTAHIVWIVLHEIQSIGPEILPAYPLGKCHGISDRSWQPTWHILRGLPAYHRLLFEVVMQVLNPSSQT